MINKKITIVFNTGMVVPTCSRSSVEALAKEVIRTFSLLPLMSEKSSKYVIKEDFMSMYLKLFIEFELGFADNYITESISNTIKEIMEHLPSVDLKYVKTDIVKTDIVD